MTDPDLSRRGVRPAAAETERLERLLTDFWHDDLAPGTRACVVGEWIRAIAALAMLAAICAGFWILTP